MSISLEAGKIQRGDEVCWDAKWYTVTGVMSGADRVCLVFGGIRVDVHKKRFLDTMPKRAPKTPITRSDLNDIAAAGVGAAQIAAERLA